MYVAVSNAARVGREDARVKSYLCVCVFMLLRYGVPGVIITLYGRPSWNAVPSTY